MSKPYKKAYENQRGAATSFLAAYKLGQGVGGGPFAAGATALAFPFAVFAPRRWLRLSNRKYRRGGRAADAGAVFYQIGATGIRAVDIISNRPAPRVASAEAIGGAGESVI